jgi:hypothetical protein
MWGRALGIPSSKNNRTGPEYHHSNRVGRRVWAKETRLIMYMNVIID